MYTKQRLINVLNSVTKQGSFVADKNGSYFARQFFVTANTLQKTDMQGPFSINYSNGDPMHDV